MTAPKLRPCLPADASRLAEIFEASVNELTQDDYDAAQRAAWIAIAEDDARFRKALTDALTLVATIDNEIAGFASLKGVDVIDMLYVHPDHARKGVATTLIDAMEKLGGARGAKRLTVDASDTARPFFAARGYVGQSRNVRMLGDEWLANTTMTKSLTGDEPHGVLQ